MKTVDCNRCGASGLAWAQSARSGKWYLTVADENGSPQRRVFHTCSDGKAVASNDGSTAEPIATAPAEAPKSQRSTAKRSPVTAALTDREHVQRTTSLLPTGEYAVTWIETASNEIVWAALYRTQVDADLGHRALKVTGDPDRLVRLARQQRNA
jgi:hypothetical protein